jgi:DNA topoisomerase III
VSKDAVGTEYTVKVEMGEESFSCTGLRVEQLNFLNVYPFETWTDIAIPVYEKGKSFKPYLLEVCNGKTTAP